jgi:hypothetical protein
MMRWLFPLLMILATVARGQSLTPQDVLSAYLEDARAGDWEAAASWWLPEDVARSTRLGVTYRDIPFKLDCSSFLVVPGVGDSLDPGPWNPVGDLEKGPVRIRIFFQSLLGSHPADYVLVREHDRWLLASMATALGRDWPVTESRYMRFRVQPGQVLNQAAIDYLDLFVEGCGAKLGLGPEKMSRLAEAKIDYLLCEEEVVEAIAGAPTKGVAMFPTDVVVTSERAHTHELVHVRVGYAAQDLGLYVLPVLQEGIAVHLGGRWGKSAGVQEELGRYILDNELVDIEAMLPWRDFRNLLPDLSYAPAGILAGYLLDELGPVGFLDLYRNLSGWSGELSGLDTYAVQAEIVPRLGIAKGTLGKEVMARSTHLSGGSIEPGSGDIAGDETELVSEGLKATITVGETWVLFDIRAEAAEPSGALMLGPVGEAEPAGQMFTERFPGQEYEGEVGAVIFNGQEAGYYDFTTEILMAKYVYGFWPSAEFMPEEGRLVFRIRRTALRGINEDWELISP